MKNKFYRYSPIVLLLLICFTFAGCKKLEGDALDALYNYDVLWKTLDEKYCYFEYKNINWDSLYTVYRKKLSLARNTEGIFNVYCGLMSELKDGHVNIYAAGNIGRYWEWFYDYPKNFSEDVVTDYYLGKDYRIASAFSYCILNPREKDKIAYVRYSSFSDGFGEGNISSMFDYLRNCAGMIIDVRQNGGGNLDYAVSLASHFTDNKFLYGYVCHKTGPGHNDFSAPLARYIEPSPYSRWTKPVVILTNRHCFSTTNDFACMMKGLPGVSLIGDTTGGGGGMPLNSELPCGWTFRYSAIPMFDANMQHTENGIAPDIHIDMDTAQLKNGVDSMIEFAVSFLKKL